MLTHLINVPNAPVWSEDLCTGGTAFASAYSSSYSPDKAFDDSLSSFWARLVYSDPSYLGYQFASGQVIQRIRIYQVAAGAARNFLIQGSNNGSSWTTLSTIVNSGMDGTSTWYTFTFSNSTSYTYYRIYISLRYSGSDYIQINEMEMLSLS